MSEITEITSAVSQAMQTELQDKSGVAVLKMALQTEKDMAGMLLKGLQRTQESIGPAEGRIDIYV